MCGITGFLEPQPASENRTSQSVLDQMTDALTHRGPDDRGTWTDGEQGIHLGHRRLSVLDLTAQGHQPMASRSGRYVLVYNGETYNHPRLRTELADHDVQFDGESDTETILAGFETWGIAGTLDRMVGMFAFAVWDREDGRLVLARDRIGEKPLYYGYVGETFVFGSELAAITAYPEFKGRIDRSALAAFLRYGNVPAPGCIWEGIHKLQPGHLLEVHPDDGPDNRSPRPYWRAADSASPGRTGQGESSIEDLERLLQDTVARTLLSDVPLGVFLSGGIDSSLVAALAQNASERPIRTFTIGFHEAEYNEAEDAKKVAAHLGTDHTELYVTPEEAQAVIPDLPRIYSEPFADSSQIPTYLVSRMAREHVTVALSGDGGDELFGGYNRYLIGAEAWRRLQAMPEGVRKAMGGILAHAPGGMLETAGKMFSPSGEAKVRPGTYTEKARKLARVMRTTDEREYYQRVVSIWQDPPLARAPKSQVEAEVPAMNGHGGPEADPVDTWMLRDALLYLPDDILVKVDRAAMAVSLETRAPFLSHEVFEAAWALPRDLKIRDGTGKWILREILAKHVPRELFERPKTGFGVPIDSWLRGPLKEWAEALLDPDRLRSEGYLDAGPIRQAWEDHQSGRHDRHHELWVALMFQAWLESHGHLIEYEGTPEVEVAA